MKIQATWMALGLVLGATGLAVGEEMEIVSYAQGMLAWSNALPGGVYRVEWASSLERGDWTSTWTNQVNLSGAEGTLQVAVPQFYRVVGQSYGEVTNPAECYLRYSNAVLDAKVALPSEATDGLLPISTNSPGTVWRLFTNEVDSTTSLWVKVAAMKYAGGWTWNTLLATGMVTMSNGWSTELWVTPYPELRDLCVAYTGSHQRLRMQKALGLPPRDGTYGVVEFYVDPQYLFRPAPDAGISSQSAGVAGDAASPYLRANPFQGISQGYADWYRFTYDSRGYEATNSLDNCYPWTRLGYTYDYENAPNSPVGLSEYVVPDPSQTPFWGEGLAVPIFVESKIAAEEYGDGTGP